MAITGSTFYANSSTLTPTIVDEDAVIGALDSEHLAAYVCDFPNNHNRHHPRVTALPHLGASTSESEENCAMMAVREVSNYLLYGNITNSVNFPNIEMIASELVLTRLIVINRDVPGMIAFITNVLGDHQINIDSYKNESNGTIGYNIIDMEADVPDTIVDLIKANDDVIRTRVIPFSR